MDALSGEGVSGSVQIGPGQTAIQLPNATHAYAFAVEVDGSGTATVDLSDGTASVTGAAIQAASTATIAINPSNNETLTVDGVVYTFKTSAVAARDVQIGASATDTRDNLVDEIIGNGIGTAHETVTASAGSGASIGFSAIVAGNSGNSIALSNSNGSTWSGFDALLSGGTNETKCYRLAGTTLNGDDFQGGLLPTDFETYYGFSVYHTAGTGVIFVRRDTESVLEEFAAAGPGGCHLEASPAGIVRLTGEHLLEFSSFFNGSYCKGVITLFCSRAS